MKGLLDAAHTQNDNAFEVRVCLKAFAGLSSGQRISMASGDF